MTILNNTKSYKNFIFIKINPRSVIGQVEQEINNIIHDFSKNGYSQSIGLLTKL